MEGSRGRPSREVARYGRDVAVRWLRGLDVDLLRRVRCGVRQSERGIRRQAGRPEVDLLEGPAVHRATSAGVPAGWLGCKEVRPVHAGHQSRDSSGDCWGSWHEHRARQPDFDLLQGRVGFLRAAGLNRRCSLADVQLQDRRIDAQWIWEPVLSQEAWREDPGIHLRLARRPEERRRLVRRAVRKTGIAHRRAGDRPGLRVVGTERIHSWRASSGMPASRPGPG